MNKFILETGPGLSSKIEDLLERFEKSNQGSEGMEPWPWVKCNSLSNL